MKILNNLNEVDFTDSIITVGTFDGLHRGHQKIIKTLIAKSKELRLPSVVFTFWPHPRFVLGKAEGLELLNTIDEKAKLLSDLGVDYLLSVEFTKKFANQTSYEFVENILVNKLHVRHLILGYDHHFGKNREGRFEKLKECGDKFNFSVEQVSALKGINENISSTKIRNLLKSGNITKANNYLGYKYFIKGKVVKGERLGRKIGFPTANISISDYKLKPQDGVYAVFVEIDGVFYKAMLNIGTKPTVNNRNINTIEVNIFDFNADIYGKVMNVFFVEKVRDEIQFPNIEALKQQLDNDRKIINKLLMDYLPLSM